MTAVPLRGPVQNQFRGAVKSRPCDEKGQRRIGMRARLGDCEGMGDFVVFLKIAKLFQIVAQGFGVEISESLSRTRATASIMMKP